MLCCAKGLAPPFLVHAVGTALFVAASVAHACALYTRDKLNFLRYLLLMLVAGGAVTIYFIIIPR